MSKKRCRICKSENKARKARGGTLVLGCAPTVYDPQLTEERKNG